MTHTRTHVVINFANPHLVCDKCKRPVTAYHDPERCGPGCDLDFRNEPCGCAPGGVTSTCPSWSPVDGCTCDPAHPVPAGAAK